MLNSTATSHAAARVAPTVRRLLMTADTVGGVWTYAMELTRALSSRGVEVVLATMGAPLRASQSAEAAAIDRLTVEESHFKLEWMDGAAKDVEAAGTWLLELEQQYQPDVIHLNGYAHGALNWTAPTVVVAHSCVHTWWQAVRGGTPSAEFAAYTEGLRRGVVAANVVVAPSRAYLNAFELAHGSLSSARVIANGRSSRRFAPGEKQPYILSVGRLWDEVKNVQALAAIAPRLPWPVRLAGDATSPDGRKLNLLNVEVLGVCPELRVAQLMAHAAIYVSPARYEPFGLSVLEAALSGCALVLGDLGSFREIWGDAAIYVPPDDSAALAAVLTALAADAAQQQRLGRRARERAARYTVAGMTEQYLSVYQQLLSQRRFPISQAAAI